MHHLARHTLLLLSLFHGAPARGQQFLFTINDEGQNAVVLADSQGSTLERYELPGPQGSAGFYGSDQWFNFGLDVVLLWSEDGLVSGSIPMPPGWNSAAAFEDGKVVVREPWGTGLAYVLDADGQTVSSWFPPGCAGGPDYGALTIGPDRVWLTTTCGSELQLRDTNGNVLAEAAPGIQIPSLFDDSNDDLDEGPDGSLWTYHGSNPATIVRLDSAGLLVSSFDVPGFVQGIAVDRRGLVWTRFFDSPELIAYDETGRESERLVHPPSWSVTSMDLRRGRSTGTSVCSPAEPNSTGGPAVLSAVAYRESRWIELIVANAPAGQAGFLLVSRSSSLVPFVGGSQGTLCLAPPIGRLAAQSFVAGPNGLAAASVDTAKLPLQGGKVAVEPGQTWFFQAWYRDHNPAPTSNLSDAVAVAF